jgi:hypothetical protein
MREFADDPEAPLHPQTAVERFGSWNRAKRRAGLVPRRFATDAELLRQLRELGERLGRTPSGRDLDERRRELPSTSLYWYRFGSFSNALRAAGFDVPGREARREQALADGEALARRLKRLPSLADWRRERAVAALLSEWQVYRLFAGSGGGWEAFHSALRERLGS